MVADGEGHAEVSIAVPTSPSDRNAFDLGSARIGAYRETWFGLGDPDLVAEGELTLPFDVKFLRSLPESPTGSWLRVLGTSDMSNPSQGCVRLGRGLAQTDVLVGSGQIDPSGGAFVGPPGTHVQLGPVEFTLGETGVSAWTPDPGELATLMSASLDEISVPLVIESPGQAPTSGDVPLTLLPECRKQLAEQFLLAVAEHRSWPAPADEREPFAVVGRLDGDLFTVGEVRDAMLRNAQFLAVEEEVSRTEDENECLINTAYLVEVHSGQTYGDRRGQPIRVATRVSIYRAEGFGLVDSQEFQPGTDCDDVVYPPRYEIEAWVRATIRKQ